MHVKRFRTSNLKVKLILLTILPALGSGCTHPLSVHPLSDEKTSVMDERLIGHWQLVEMEKQRDRNMALFVVGRVQDTENTLELVFADVTQSGNVKIFRQSLYLTSIAGHNYLSVEYPYEADRCYSIFRYKLIEHDPRHHEDDELQLFAVDPNALGRAILDKQLPGKATWYETPDKPDAKVQWVRTSASPEQLQEYIGKHEQELFDKSSPLVLKKGRPFGL